VNGYIQRSEPHVYYSPKIGLTHVGQGDEVPLEKGKPIIVVLEVKRVAHAFWQLVYEAEDAFVGAMLLAIEHEFVESKPEAGIVVVAENNLYSFSGGPLDYKARLRGANMVLVIYYVANMVTVYGDQEIPWTDSRLVGAATLVNPCDLRPGLDDRLHRLVYLHKE